MNNVFNINRFGKVLAKDGADFFPKFGWPLVILIAIPLLFWILGFIEKDTTIGIDTRKLLIIKLCLLGVLLVPARLYRDYNDSKKGMAHALLPASSLEKFLSMIIFCMIVTPIVILFGNVVLDIILTIIPHSPYQGYLWQATDFNYFTRVNSLFEIDGMFFPNEYNDAIINKVNEMSSISFSIFSLIGITSIFMLGNMLFKKHKTTKTIGILVLIFFVAIISTFIFIANGSGFQSEEDVFNFTNNALTVFLFGNYILPFAMLFFVFLKIKTQKY